MIRIEKLVKFYDKEKIIDNISFKVEKGSIHGLIGASGIGKSTILKNISLLEKYDGGEIHIDGKEISTLKGVELREYRKNIGIVFQNFSLLERLNVYQNIALPLKIWKYSKNNIDKIVNKLLKIIYLEDKKYELPRNLSGGQKQRVAIARALALNPKVLICDEATSSLDPKMTKEISKLLLDINKRLGITILVVSHDLDMIKDVCDKTTILKDKSNLITDKTSNIFLEGNVELEELIGKTYTENEDMLRVVYPIDKINLFENMVKEISFSLNIVNMTRNDFVEEEYFTIDILKDRNYDYLKTYLKERNIHFIEKKGNN